LIKSNFIVFFFTPLGEINTQCDEH
jgi:hypothetical protein